MKGHAKVLSDASIEMNDGKICAKDCRKEKEESGMTNEIQLTFQNLGI